MTYLYLDNNATTRMHQKVIERIASVMGTPLNPSSLHYYGRRAKFLVEEAREQILKSLNQQSPGFYDLVFVASGTEANNLLIHNFKDTIIFISPTEHASIHNHAKVNSNIKYLRVDNNGILDLEDLALQLSAYSGKKLVSVIYANNETGVIQPLKEIAEISKKYNAVFHSDCSQALGKISMDLSDPDPDIITISSHKCYGPAGIAALIYKKSIDIAPQIIGGGQERRKRSGTESVAAIVGFSEACRISSDILSKMEGVKKLRDKIEGVIRTHAKDAKIFGSETRRLPNTSMIYMPRVKSEIQLMKFDLAGICVSAGSACSSGKLDHSYVLKAMNASDEEASCSIRVSLSYDNTEQEIDIFISEWIRIYDSLSSKHARHVA